MPYFETICILNFLKFSTEGSKYQYTVFFFPPHYKSQATFVEAKKEKKKVCGRNMQGLLCTSDGRTIFEKRRTFHFFLFYRQNMKLLPVCKKKIQPDVLSVNTNKDIKTKWFFSVIRILCPRRIVSSSLFWV